MGCKIFDMDLSVYKSISRVSYLVPFLNFFLDRMAIKQFSLYSR